MTDRPPFVAGNWKMHLTRPEAAALAAATADAAQARPGVEVGIFPPYTLLDVVHEALDDSPVVLGGQACHGADSGAHTGEISAPMLVESGCTAVLCGHSERRAAGESDHEVGVRVRAALRAGLRVVLCVGETLPQREEGETDTVLVHQLDAGLADVEPAALEHVDVAYEPVWAIGTGRTATPAMAAEAHATLRRRLVSRFGDPGQGPRILYGGSVKPSNARELMHTDDVGGVLVGGASLDAESFRAIIESA